MSSRHFGPVPGIQEGNEYPTRQALHDVGIHPPTQAGISGSPLQGADSIVLSGGYEDDFDDGAIIIYTGHGGRDVATGKQVADQTFDRGNLALARNQLTGLPVRVTRGSRHASPLSPSSGYRYGGLYRVEDHWHEAGKSGFRIYRFRLVKTSGKVFTSPTGPLFSQAAMDPTPRITTTVQRLVRNTATAQRVKEWHNFTCQICGIRLETPAGPYAEAAHIRPLGAPHHGPDEESNILCLCPNHHVLFDLGAFTIGPDYAVLGLGGTLRLHPQHQIDGAHLQYHRERYFPTGPYYR